VGGKTGVLLDVGCGPGMATRIFSKHFDLAIGADPGESMIKLATELGGETAKGEPVRWVISTAEEIDKIEGLEKGSVDLVIAAFAAHWFDMPKFWAAAAEVMKPGGTVALWTSYREVAEPKTPEEAKVRAVFNSFHKNVIEAYAVEGGKISSNGYRDLILPWSDNSGLSPTTAALFNRDAFVRKDLTRQELATGDTAKAVAKDPLATSIWQRVENLLDTLDPVTRWREAHPELAGTDKDCVKILIAETVEAVKDGKPHIDFGNLLMDMKTVVLFVKRVAA